MIKNIDPRLVVGFVLSISIAIIFYVTGRNTVESLTVGLLGSIFTILNTIRLDMQKTETQLLEAIGLNQELHKDDWLRDILQKIITNYFAIKLNPSKPMYIEQLQATLQTCSTTLNELAKGKISVQEEDERTKLIIKSLQETNTSVKAVSYPNRWYTQLGNRFLKENRLAVDRGVLVERILIIPNKPNDEVMKLINEQMKSGVKLRIALESSLPSELQRNFVIFDDTLVTLPRFNRQGINEGGIISASEWDIYQTQQLWERLHLYSQIIHSDEELSTVIEYLMNLVQPKTR